MDLITGRKLAYVAIGLGAAAILALVGNLSLAAILNAVKPGEGDITVSLKD
jgi:hypothetical protein